MEATTARLSAAPAPAPATRAGIPLWRLLRWQLHLSVVSALRGGHGRVARRGLFLALGLLWLALIGVGVDLLLGQALALHPEAAWLPDIFLQSAWLGALAITLFLNLGFLLHLVFYARDVAFLLAAPVDPRHVIVVRFAEAMGANLFMTLFLTLPTTVAVGHRTGAGADYYLVSLATLLGFLAVPVALTFLVGIPLASRLPATRLKAFFSILGFVAALVLWVVPYQMVAGGHTRWDVLMDRAEGLRQLFAHPASRLLPSTWAASVVVAARQGEMGTALIRLALLTLAALGLGGLAVVGCAGLYRTGWALAGATAETEHLVRRPWERLLVGLPRPLRAVFWKDLCLVGRDFRLMFQLYSIGAMFCVFPFVMLMSRGAPLPAQLRPVMAMAAALGTAVIVSSQAGMMLVPVEGVAGFRMLTAPLRPRALALAKWLAAFFLTLPIVALQLPVIGLGFGLGLTQAVTGTLWGVVGAVAGSALGLLLGAAFPNFAWDHPKRIVQPTAQMGWGFGVALIVTALSIMGQLGGYFLPGWLGGPWLPLLVLLPAGAGAAIVIAITGRLLAELEWPN